MKADPSSRKRLTPAAAHQYESESLFDRIARAVCAADCLPRKELHESWEVARRARRRFRGGRVWDLACGHGLVAHLMLLLDDTSPDAIAIDPKIPASAAKLARAIGDAWPRLEGRVKLQSARIEDATPSAGDLVVSAHACGELSDRVIEKAIGARARLALLPCCHDRETCDTGALDGWMDVSLAIDATRAAKLRAANYAVYTQSIPAEITPKNRLLLACPQRQGLCP